MAVYGLWPEKSSLQSNVWICWPNILVCKLVVSYDLATYCTPTTTSTCCRFSLLFSSAQIALSQRLSPLSLGQSASYSVHVVGELVKNAFILESNNTLQLHCSDNHCRLLVGTACSRSISGVPSNFAMQRSCP